MWVFDWYSATLRDDSVGGANGALAVERLRERLGAVVDDGPALHGYGSGVTLRSRDGDSLARCMYGGKQPWPLVIASGWRTPAAAAAVRELWPDTHLVTRADSAADYDEAGAWDRLYQTALTFADERGLKVNQAGDWHRGEEGRTLYVGSMSSAVFLRVYEKGLQMRSKGMQDASRDWCRVELSVKPVKDARRVVAHLTASEVWGTSKWAMALRERLDGAKVAPYLMKEHRDSDHRRAVRAMLAQYGPTLRRERMRLGSWDAVGEFLGGALDA